MATIKNRAHAYARERCCKFCFDDGHCDEFCNGYENAVYFYEKIAKEQREVDIDAAQKHICNTFCQALTLALDSKGICERCKAKEKLRKTMEAEQ